MIKTHRKTIELLTDEGTIELTFSPAVPKGFIQLADAINTRTAHVNAAAEMSKKDRKAGAYLLISQDYNDILNIRSAIKAALPDSEWQKLEGIIDDISIGDVMKIACILLEEYSKLYQSMMTEGLEP